MLTYGYQNVNKDNNVHSLKCGNILLQKYSERMCIYKTQSGRTLRKQHAPGCLFFNQSVESTITIQKTLEIIIVFNKLQLSISHKTFVRSMLILCFLGPATNINCGFPLSKSKHCRSKNRI
jgi:hypothetical protein